MFFTLQHPSCNIYLSSLSLNIFMKSISSFKIHFLLKCFLGILFILMLTLFLPRFMLLSKWWVPLCGTIKGLSYLFRAVFVLVVYTHCSWAMFHFPAFFRFIKLLVHVDRLSSPPTRNQVIKLVWPLSCVCWNCIFPHNFSSPYWCKNLGMSIKPLTCSLIVIVITGSLFHTYR